MRLLWILLLLPTLAFAQSDEVQPWQVVAAKQADLTGDFRDERAILVNDLQPRGNLALYIYVFDETSLQYELATYALNAAWEPDGFGWKTTLTANEDGYLEVMSVNDSSSRFRGDLELTISYLDGVFTLVKYNRFSYDSRDLDSARRCILDFSAGEGEMRFPQTGKITPFTHAIATMPVSEWPKDLIRTECESHE